MVGYASSADTHLDCTDITVGVFLSEYLPDTDTGVFELYSVKRDFSRVRKLKGNCDDFSLPYQSFIKIAQLLHSEEIKNRCACRISWRSTDGSYIEKIKTEFLEKVWLPTPALVDYCKDRCINITSAFFKDTPKPLEASTVCDVLNLITAHTNLSLGHSFFNCMNSVYCSEGVLRVVDCIFGGSSFLRHITKHSKCRINIQKEILDPLRTLTFPDADHCGSCRDFATDAKREYFSSVCISLCDAIESQSSLENFLSTFSSHTAAFSDKLISLAGVFAEAENINSVSDVSYLTLYELFSAFAFYDARLVLKTAVSRNRLRQRILNRLNQPVIIYNEGIFDYEN